MSLSRILREDLAEECPVLERYFRADNKRGIATCLAQLKSDPKRCKEFVNRASRLDFLVQLLRCENHAVVNVSLSILADACMAVDAREKVKNSKIGFNVVLIIKNLKLDAKLHCRACRLVSNLSECSWHAKELCNAGVVEALAAFLVSKTDRQTYCMAIRAVRNIWNFYKNIRETMIELKIIKLVAQLFVMAVDAKYAELVDACLKAMCAFLVTLDPRCGEQMHVNKNMEGYKCLMHCCKASNKMAVKCLYTLCQIAQCRLDLGISGTVEQLIKLINIADSSSHFLCKEMLISLCLFCRESVNRDRIRQNAGLQVIVALLNKPEHEYHHPVLLEALSQFIHDEIGLDILTKHGILEVLVAKLTDMVIVAKNSERSGTSRKRSSNSPAEDYYKKPFKYPTLRRYSMDFYRDDWSPRSATSASSSSPPSTPPLLPYSDSNAETDDLEDDYSPVYNDTECDNDEEEEAASLKSYKSLTTVEADSDSSSSNSETLSGMNDYEYYTLLLLNRLSLHERIDKLAESTTIKSLTDYIKYAKKQSVLKYRGTAVKILTRIMGNAAYFLPLLKQGLVFEVQTLPEAEECTRHLRAVAETGGAIGDLSFILLRGEEELKLLTAVSIPLLIKTQLTLNCLLKKNRGLQLIFHLLAESSHKLHERAIWSICQLAKTLEIHPDDCSTAETATNTGELCDYSRLSLDETNYTKPFTSSMVTFELDDGTTVEACRQTLCQCSPVFSAMLEGNFSESSKRRVRLRDTSRNGLKTLILAVSGDAFEDRNIESLLDAVLLADKFLMPRLTDMLTENSIIKLDHENFYRAWCWARNHSCHELKSYCVRNFLMAKMSWSETMRTFRDFYATDTFNEFLCEIRNIIMDALCQC